MDLLATFAPFAVQFPYRNPQIPAKTPHFNLAVNGCDPATNQGLLISYQISVMKPRASVWKTCWPASGVFPLQLQS